MSDVRHRCDICGGIIADRRWVKLVFRDEDKKDKEEFHQEFHSACYVKYNSFIGELV